MFAEMLVRTGAQKITLIDGDKVDESNLNRVISFVYEDVGKSKVDVLKSRLESINSNTTVKAVSCHFREYDPNDSNGQEARDEICNSDVVVIAVDKNKDRMMCEKLCYEDVHKKVIGIGVYVNEGGFAGYECSWSPRTPDSKKEEEGYGIGSYASIVIEATAVAFSMLLHNLKNPVSSNLKYFFKSYKNFVPQKNCSVQSS